MVPVCGPQVCAAGAGQLVCERTDGKSWSWTGEGSSGILGSKIILKLTPAQVAHPGDVHARQISVQGILAACRCHLEKLDG